jgi:hypothetical protein
VLTSNSVAFPLFPLPRPAAIEQHFINFTSGIEWRFTGGATCGEYGVDEWNDWSYGPSQNEEYTATISIGETQVNLWAVMDANYTYGADATSCLPVVRVFQQDIESTFYYDTSLGIANPNTFIPPSQCHTTKSWRMIQQGAGVEEIREYSRTLRRAPAGAAGKAHASACKGEKTHTKVHGKKHHKHAKLSKAADAQFSEARAALRAHFH